MVKNPISELENCEVDLHSSSTYTRVDTVDAPT